MTHRLDNASASPRRLSHSLVQAAEMLGLVRAEVGRILGYRCEQFTLLFEGRRLLQPGTRAYQQAELFVQFFNLLYDKFNGDAVRMVNWFRRHHKVLGNSPFYLIIDEGKLALVVSHLQSAQE